MSSSVDPGRLEIRALGPERVDDFLGYCDRDAFADNPWWAGCFCNFYESLTHPAEIALCAALRQVRQSLDAPIESLADFGDALQPLVEPINSFFDQVLVNDPDERVRANRLRLLRDAAALARQRFDVAALGGGR